MNNTSIGGSRGDSARNDILKTRNRRSVTIFAAAASVALALRARSDTYYLQVSGSPNWNSTNAWRDTTTSSNSNFPPAGSIVNVLQSGGNGVTNTDVTLNFAYTGTGLTSLSVDSGDTVSQSSGTSAMIAGMAFIGSVTNGTGGSYVQNAGTANLGTLYPGYATNSFGGYTLGGGNLSAGILNDGFQSQGSYSQTGGNANFTTATVGYNVLNNVASYFSLQGGNLTATSFGVGYESTGYASQTGGNASFNQLNLLGNATNTSVVAGYTISGGTLTAATIFDGLNGAGSFTQSGGTVNVTSFAIVGNGTGTSTYNLSGGNLYITTSANNSYIGGAANGTFNQSGGIANINYLELGENAGVVGTYNLSNTAQVSFIDLYVGGNGSGAYNQTGGTTTVTAYGNNGVFIGTTAGGTGTVTVSGGTFSVPNGQIYVGDGGNGNFTQNGGTVSAAYLNVGYNDPGAVSTYNLQSGVLSIQFNEFIGYASSGSFVQSGGTNTVFQYNPLFIGYSSGGSGTYTLGGGLLVANADIFVGNGGTGTFIQNGGTATINGDVGGTLFVGGSTNTTSTYTLNGGLLSGTDATEWVGNNSYGAFTQNGGINALAGTGTVALIIGAYGGSGTYTLSGGALQLTGTGYEIIGDGTSGIFNQTGGTNSVSGTLFVSYAGGSAAYNLSGGLLSAGTVQVDVGGTFNQTGGTLNATVFDLVGGLVTGTLQNTGTFNYSSGTFSGRLLNQGTVNLGTSFTAGNGIENDVSMTVSAGQTVTANGAGFDNEGALTLAGGVIGGSAFLNNGFISGYGTFSGTGGFTNNGYLTQGAGTLTLATVGPNINTGNIVLAAGRQFVLSANLTNSGSLNLGGGLISGTATLSNSTVGTISGYGTIGGPLTNAGTLLAQGGVLNVTKPFINSNLVQLAGPGATLNGAGLTNAATVQGNGTIGMPIDNQGTIEAVGGTLLFSGPLTNESTGLLRAATGTKILVSSGLATNPGIINLAGGTFDNGGKPLVNSGQISGYGTLAANSMTNNASVVFTGGAAAVNGTFVNGSGGTVRVNYTSALFTGAVVNNGAFLIQSGSATFASGFTNNGTYTSDPSINSFTDLSVGTNGALVGGTGDRFAVSGSLTSSSGRPNAWNTESAALEFTAGGSSTHEIGVDGIAGGGYSGNFAWGTLELDSGQTLVLQDSTGSNDAALYASVIQLDGAPSEAALPGFIASELQSANASDPVDIYYDSSQVANGYLADGTYALGDGGVLAPAIVVPEPAALGLFLLAPIFARRRRRTSIDAQGRRSEQ